MITLSTINCVSDLLSSFSEDLSSENCKVLEIKLFIFFQLKVYTHCTNRINIMIKGINNPIINAARYKIIFFGATGVNEAFA